MIQRYLKEKIQKDLNKGKIIIIYGPRQVGKTTLIKQFLTPDTNGVYYNCDSEETRLKFKYANLEKLTSAVSPYSTIILDEAQRIKNIGLILKILIDNFPEKNFLVTGSSSFELSNRIIEPLTGRFFSYFLYPISFSEYITQKNPIQRIENRENLLLYGSYPKIILESGREEKERLIKDIAESYLFKDILVLDGIKNSDALRIIVRSLALQVGSEVSIQELSEFSGVDNKTVKRYIDILEKTFIIFSLPPFFTNKRKSISRKKKYYFYDTGIRNALILNFNPLEIRNDVGALWENFMMVERMKRNQEKNFTPLRYFWRSYQGQEVDLLEEYGGEINGFEFKWKKDYVSETNKKSLLEGTGAKNIQICNKENFEKFLV